jgi:hypothetical protein
MSLKIENSRRVAKSRPVCVGLNDNRSIFDRQRAYTSYRIVIVSLTKAKTTLCRKL